LPKIEIIINIYEKSNYKEFCDLIYSIQIIDLETNDESVFGFAERVIIVNDKIFIHDIQTNSIIIFKYPCGKFQTKINNRGVGPGEYLNISSFYVDSENMTIEILDNISRKMITYDEKGIFIKEDRLPFYAKDFRYFNDGKNIVFVNYSFGNYNNLDHEIIIVDNNFQIINKYLKIERFTSHLIRQNNQISILQDQIISFLPKNSSYIFHINDSLTLKYHINFGKNWNTDFFYTNVDNPRQLVEIANRQNLVRGLSAIETNDKLLISFWYNNELNMALYDKNYKQHNLIRTEIFNKRRMFLRGVFNDYFLFIKEFRDPDNSTICSFERTIINSGDDIETPSLILIKFK